MELGIVDLERIYERGFFSRISNQQEMKKRHLKIILRKRNVMSKNSE